MRVPRILRGFNFRVHPIRVHRMCIAYALVQRNSYLPSASR